MASVSRGSTGGRRDGGNGRDEDIPLPTRLGSSPNADFSRRHAEESLATAAKLIEKQRCLPARARARYRPEKRYRCAGGCAGAATDAGWETRLAESGRPEAEPEAEPRRGYHPVPLARVRRESASRAEKQRFSRLVKAMQ